ncbi:Chromate resistance protein ChrB [Alteromonas profundi]|jgi:DNA-binding transcriptional regulator PaaX|uniref:Chromate resistance protein ChrB n=1 Tax=Alteromonas profundi TaxID=2696062 RepID=UPI002E8770E4|nr:Chromate resistance protein ChrB [Pseudomonadota bacterium]
MSWILLILSLPTENATVRMRAWRAIKALGAVSLRDGVYLLPAISDHAEKLEAIAQDVRDSGGTAHVLHANDPETEAFPRYSIARKTMSRWTRRWRTCGQSSCRKPPWRS